MSRCQKPGEIPAGENYEGICREHTMITRNVETIVTIHCKECGETLSLGSPLGFEEARLIVENFNEQHQHPEPNPSNTNPWVI